MKSTYAIEDRIIKCQRILDENPNSQIFAALAESFRKKGEIDKAFRICHNGLKIHPSYAPAHVVMAKINLDRGLYDWAEVEAKKAIEIEGSNRTNDLLMAEIHIYKGEFKKAIRLLSKLNETEPDNLQIKKLLEIAQRIPEENKQIFEPEKKAVAPLKPKEEDLAEYHEETIIQTSTQAKLTEKDLVRLGIGIPEFDGVIIVNNEGLVIESEWTLDSEEAEVSATLAQAADMMNQELMQSCFGAFQATQIEANNYFYFIKRVDVGLVIFISSDQTNLGSARMKIDHLLGRYQ